MAYRKKPLAERFWKKVDRRGPNECWPWKGGVSRRYGAFFNGRSMWPAHRTAWELATGKSALGLAVRHTCDNPPCCNPAHLIGGTVAENNRDMFAKGRNSRIGARGELNSHAALDVKRVLAIREEHASRREPYAQIARRVGVTPETVSMIVRRLTWRHI